MQPLPIGVTLNVLCAFEAVARRGSVKHAAAELSVRPSAVSHQLRQLGQALGVLLLHRRNNAIDLSDKGRAFARDLSPAFDAIAAARRVTPDANEVSLLVSSSLAMRWLILGLDAFRIEHPGIRESGSHSTPWSTRHRSSVTALISPSPSPAASYRAGMLCR